MDTILFIFKYSNILSIMKNEPNNKVINPIVKYATQFLVRSNPVR